MPEGSLVYLHRAGRDFAPAALVPFEMTPVINGLVCSDLLLEFDIVVITVKNLEKHSDSADLCQTAHL